MGFVAGNSCGLPDGRQGYSESQYFDIKMDHSGHHRKLNLTYITLDFM